MVHETKDEYEELLGISERGNVLFLKREFPNYESHLPDFDKEIPNFEKVHF